MMRLDKFLCETGFGTRSQVKELLKKGQVTVNGVAAKKPEQKIDEHKDQITCQGKTASYEKHVYYMLHKPAGVVSATEDKREKTVLDLLKPEDRRDGIFPVGRLDKDTEGFLLLTDDGDLAHRLLSPRKHVDKTYYAKIAGSVTETHIERFRERSAKCAHWKKSAIIPCFRPMMKCVTIRKNMRKASIRSIVIQIHFPGNGW